MNTITIGTGRRVAEASIINACSSAFASKRHWLLTVHWLRIAGGGNVSSISGKGNPVCFP